MAKTQLNTQQIGRAGELLVQFRLLKYGIDSALLTTDAGIDLVAYSPTKKRAFTIQVKTDLEPRLGGGKGKPALEWSVSPRCPADLIALVHLRDEEVWLFTREEFHAVAQQQPSGKNMLFYMYVDPDVQTRTGKKALKYQFSAYLLENSVHKIFFGLHS